MSILVSEDILDTLNEEIKKCEDSFIIISAFCKVSLIEYFDSKLSEAVRDKKLIVRLRPEDILKGATDLSLYNYCSRNNWELYFKLDLHAKTYIFDSVRCIVGSANATSKGLSVGGVGNYEMAVCGVLDDKDKNAIASLFESATLIDDYIFKIMSDTIESHKNDLDCDLVSWPEEIIKLQQEKYDVMFTEDFPSTRSPYEDGNSGSDFVNSKQAFLYSRGYLWLENLLKERSGNEIYFGEATALLHSVLIKDPKPYRKDVKILLSNLLNWIQELDCENIIIDRPNHSQRIRLKHD